MKKQLRKLTLNKETLRDLTTQNAAGVKGGDKSKNCNHTLFYCGTKHCRTANCASLYCTWGC